MLLLLTGSSVFGQDVRTGVEQLASQIAQRAPEGKQLRVVVADFPDLQNVTSDLGRFIASRLTTRLAQSPKFSVVERQRLNQVLGELRFSMSDLVDPTKAKQLGRMTGAEAIVVGTVSDLGNQVDLDARMIDVETNRMLLGATVTISKDPTVEEMLKRGRQEGVATSSTPSPAPLASTPSRTGGSDSVEGFAFHARGCKRSGGKLMCTIAFVNMGNEAMELYVNGNRAPKSQLIDNMGNQYPASVQIGERFDKQDMKEKFAPQLPVNVHFITEEVNPAATHMNVVIGTSNQFFQPIFKKTPVVRDIPISR